ncbi:phosphate acyltransferase [Jeotgalicoccus marinus]|uniref:phosphate acyltransferase n=1 Tax=Jeotgalicoccus marinus TaxID=516700 RepID=UPI000562F13E|nr:phosphate acyltransferase [Jeotgalicoccus marinus]
MNEGGIFINFDSMLNHNRSPSQSIALVRANSNELLEIVRETVEKHEIKWHLYDDESLLVNSFKDMGFDYQSYDIELHDVKEDTEAAGLAAKDIHSGRASVLMKGLISTGTILKAVLNKELDLLDKKVLSHVALFDIPTYHKPIIISDAAMNIDVDNEKKVNIIENAIEVAENLNINKPKVALISAVEKVNEKIHSTVTNDTIVKADLFSNAIVDGPMSYDLAMSATASEIKGYKSEVAGDADILIMPHIDAGNVLFKALTVSAGAHSAGIITGLKVPFVLTSRADTKVEKYNSIKLALQMLN